MDTTQPARAPIVERVAGWSARHKKTAVFGWLLLVVAAVLVGQRLGTSHVNSYDPGSAGRAERVLDRPVVQQPAAETVLIRSPPRAWSAGSRYWSPSTWRASRITTTRRSCPR
jgi:RND superfamily putative drug exporter